MTGASPTTTAATRSTEGEHRAGAVGSPSPAPSGARQACFLVAPEYAARVYQLLTDKAIVGWPAGVEVVGSFPVAETGELLVLVRTGPDGAGLPADGVLVDLVVYRGGDEGVYFDSFDVRLGKYA